jgi:hypothetical protein
MNGMHQRLPAGERVLDLLDDPIAQMVMRRDGVTREEVLSVVAEMRRRLAGPGCGHTEPPGRAGKTIRLAA